MAVFGTRTGLMAVLVYLCILSGVVVNAAVLQVEGIDGNLRLNNVQFIGTYNSYRKQPTNDTKKALVDLASQDFGPGINELDALFSYSQQSLQHQLEQGIRVFEFKVYPDSKGGSYIKPKLLDIMPEYGVIVNDLEDNFLNETVQEDLSMAGFKVMRIPDYDFQSTCYTLQSCLFELKDWSDAQKADQFEHLPIFVLITLASYQTIFHNQKLTQPENMTAQLFLDLEQEILNVFDEEDIVMPSNLTKGNSNASLRMLWPRVAEVKNKFLFIMTHLMQQPYYDYNSAKEGSDGTDKVLFTTPQPGMDGSGFVFLGEPIEANLEQQMVHAAYLIQRGYIVILRAESGRGNNATRNAVFGAGTQIIPTHFPKSLDYNYNYEKFFVAFDDGKMARQSNASTNEIAVDDIREQWMDVPISKAQFIGTHNSYRIQPSKEEWNVLLANVDGQLEGLPKPDQLKQFKYTHQTLKEQLDIGIRQIELDVYPDPSGKKYQKRLIEKYAEQLGLPMLIYYDHYPEMQQAGFKVMHNPEFDSRSYCILFTNCLQEIKEWSDENSDHALITVLIEIKEDSLYDTLHKQLFADLEIEISNTMGGSLLKLSDLLGGYQSMEERIQAEGFRAWPTFKQTQGKIMFVVAASEKVTQLYDDSIDASQRIPLLQPYPLVTLTKPKDGCYFVEDPAHNQGLKIQNLVKQGYIVRTRADKSGEHGITGNTLWRDAAFESGAQYISTDYPLIPNYGIQFSNYFVSFENGRAIRAPDLEIVIELRKCGGFPSKQGGQYFLMVLLGIIIGMTSCVCCKAYLRGRARRYRQLQEGELEMRNMNN